MSNSNNKYRHGSFRHNACNLLFLGALILVLTFPFVICIVTRFVLTFSFHYETR